MTTGTESPCICANGVELRSQQERDDEIRHYCSRLARLLDHEGYYETHHRLGLLFGDWERMLAKSPQPVTAEPAEAA